MHAHRRYIMQTYARPNLVFTHGEGARLYDAHGKEYLDFAAGIAVNALGAPHAPPHAAPCASGAACRPSCESPAHEVAHGCLTDRPTMELRRCGSFWHAQGTATRDGCAQCRSRRRRLRTPPTYSIACLRCSVAPIPPAPHCLWLPIIPHSRILPGIRMCSCMPERVASSAPCQEGASCMRSAAPLAAPRCV